MKPDKIKQFETMHKEDLAEIEHFQAKGHSRHCACRMIWGDGECECDLYNKGYDPYAWMKLTSNSKQD